MAFWTGRIGLIAGLAVVVGAALAFIGFRTEERAKAFADLEVVIHANAGAEGKLFGSVGPIDIVEALGAVQVEVERSEVRMPDGPVQELGEYPIGIHLHSEVNAEVLVKVVGEEQ